MSQLPADKDVGQAEMIEMAERESGEVNSQDSLTERPKWTWAKTMACIALGMSFTTAIQQQACTASVVKHIDIALGPTNYYNWIISGHNITVSLMLPLAGGLSDIFGRRYFFIAGCCFSLIGTIVALAATSVPMVIAGMVLKGMGSGSQQLSLPAIGELVPNKHRGTAQAILDLAGLPWMVFGALIGNSMVKYYALSFKVNFIIGIVLNLLTILLTYFFYHPPRGELPEGKTAFQTFLELDWLGIFLLACGIVLTLVGIAFGGTIFPWASVGVILPVCIGITSFIALLIWEWKGAKNPFFSHELFDGPNNRFGVCLILTLVGGMSLYAAAAFWTQEAQAMYFSDPTKIGLSAIPAGMGTATGGFIAGISIGRAKLFKANLVLFYGTALKLVADGLFTTLTPKTLTLGLAAGFMGMFGIGLILIGTIVTVQLTCIDKHIGLATLVLGSVRSMGGSLAVTIYSSIMTNSVNKDAPVRVGQAVPELSKESLESLVKLLIGGRPKQALSLPGVTPAILETAKETIKWSWAVAFQRIYYACMVFTILAMIASFFIKDVRSNMTDNVAVTLRNDTSKKTKDVER